MSSSIERTNEPKLTDEQSAAIKVLHDRTREFQRDWVSNVGLTVLGLVLSVAASAISSGYSLSSLVRSLHIRTVYLWFIIGLVGFQSILTGIIWVIRKKNREVVRLKTNLIDTYLFALNRSSLNPKHQSSTLE
jgi:uncharacterized membrane protein